MLIQVLAEKEFKLICARALCGLYRGSVKTRLAANSSHHSSSAPRKRFKVACSMQVAAQVSSMARGTWRAELHEQLGLPTECHLLRSRATHVCVQNI
eukprot:5437362-Amphidinium_carterae.1